MNNRLYPYNLIYSFSLAIVLLATCFPASATSKDSNAKSPKESKGVLATLREEIHAIIDAPQFASTLTGIEIVSLKDGRTLFSLNSGKLFHPASNMKILTTSAALAELGNFNYRTVVSTNGRVADSTLHGNLIIKGSGDGILSIDNLDSLATLVASKGIKNVTGDIIGNVSYFDSVSWGPGWMWDDEPESDEPFITPLSVNGNSIRVTVHPGLTGKSGSYEIIPSLESFALENLSITSTDTNIVALNVLRPHGENRFIIQGRVNPADTATHLDVSVSRPELFFLELLKQSLAAKGVTVSGQLKIDSLEGKTRLAEFVHPIDSVLTHINKNSENLGAEDLLKTLAAVKMGSPGTWNNGIILVKNYLAGLGIDTSDVLLFDGSGVSFYNAISPDIVVKVLADQFHRKKTFERFYSTLPIAGVDGTLKGRMKRAPTEGNVHAKTGTITGVSSLSGYVTTAAGRMLAFSILNNHSPRQSHELHVLQDEIVTLLAKLNY